MSLICGDGPDFPDAGKGGCCIGSAMRGPSGCTCWKRVFDREQAEPDPQDVELLRMGVEPNTRGRMCGDCAYRPDSPEKSGEEGYAGSADTLDDMAMEGRRFFCHDGMRRVVEWVHGPTGVRHPAYPGEYAPPVVDDVPFQADGTAAILCAGWAARRRALLAQLDAEEAQNPALR